MVELADLPEDLREQAAARFRLLEPHLNEGRELRSVVECSGVSFCTLQR